MVFFFCDFFFENISFLVVTEVTPANPNPLPVPGRVHLNSYTPVIAGTLRIVLGMNVPNFIGDWQRKHCVTRTISVLTRLILQ